MSASRPGRDPRCGDVSSLVIICGSCSVHTATRRCHATPVRAYRVHRMLVAWLLGRICISHLLIFVVRGFGLPDSSYTCG